LVTRTVLLSLCIGALLCTSFAENLFVREWEQNYSTEKQNEVIQCMDVGDLDNDGRPEIVLGLSIRPQAGVQQYAVQIVDHNGEKLYRWDSTYPINGVAISDLDDDGTAEILVSGADLYVLSSKAQNLNYPPAGTVVSAAEAEDLDGDGKKELLVGSREISCRGETINWTVSIGSQIKKIVVSDLSSDGISEVVILTEQKVYVLDKDGERVWISPETQSLRDVAVADIDGDRTKEILFSTDNMLILIWEAREDGLEREIDLKSYRADVLAVEDVDKDGVSEIIVASSKLRLEILDAEGESLWQYRFRSKESQDTFTEMIVYDMDGNQWKDILLAHAVNALGGSVDSFLYLMKNQAGISPPSQGAEYFNRAVVLFEAENCIDAVDLFHQAQALFVEEGNQEMADQCQEYIEECEELFAKQADAEAKFSQAEGLFQQGEYDTAMAVYEEARTLYQELGDTEKVQQCSDRIEEIEQLQVPEETPVEDSGGRGSGLILLAVILAVGIAISYFGVTRYIRKRPELEREEKVEEKEREEQEEEPETESVPSEEIREEERKLKAQFVYGEINKEEYKEKLRKLYEDRS